MSQDELVQYLVFCQDNPKVFHYHILSPELKIGIFGPNEAFVFDRQNLVKDTLDIGHPPTRHFTGNEFASFYHTSPTTGFGLNTNLMTFFSWEDNQLKIDRFTPIRTPSFYSIPKAKHEKWMLINEGIVFGYTMDAKETGLHPPKKPPVYFFASKERYWQINPKPLLVNMNVYNSDIGMASWFEGGMFIVGKVVYISAEMENRLYMVNVETKEISFYTLPNPPNKGTWRIFYDYIENKFYGVNKSKLGYEISSISRDFKTFSQPHIIVDQEPVNIMNAKVQVVHQAKRNGTPCHYLIPIFDSMPEF